MKQFRLTVTTFTGATVFRVLSRKTLEDAIVAFGGFIGALANDEIVKRVTIEEIRPMREPAENFSLAAEALNRVFPQSWQPVCASGGGSSHVLHT